MNNQANDEVLLVNDLLMQITYQNV